MHEAAFARAALPATTQVLGMVLRPYSIGHDLFIQREALESPTNANLIQSVLICCHGWTEARRLSGDWLLGLKLRIWGRRLRKVDWPREREKFEQYRIEGCLEFRLSEIIRPGRAPRSRPPGAPFLLRLHQFLVTRLHKTEAEAWDYPLGLAKMQWAAYWEEEGGLQIYNWEDAEHDAFVAKMEAEEQAELKGGSNA